MAVIIESSTDSPEDVAAAMGVKVEKEGEIEGEEKEAETNNNLAEGEAEEGAAAAGGDNSQSEGEDESSTGAEGEGEAGEEASGDGKKAVVKGKASGAKSGDAEGEDEGEEESEGETKPKKKLGGFQKTIKRQQETIDLLTDLLKKEGKTAPKTEESEEQDNTPKTFSGLREPELEDFKEAADPYAEFTKAHSKWSHKEAVAEMKAEQARADAEKAENSNQTSFQTRALEISAEDGLYPDYDEKIEEMKGEDLPISPVMQAAMHRSGLAPDVAYYFATHLDECHEIIEMDQFDQAIAMGRVIAAAKAETDRRIEAKKAESGDSGGKAKTSSKKKVETAPAGGKTAAAGEGTSAKPKTKPPAPINPVGKRGAPANQDLETVASRGDFSAYEARRKAQGWKYS